MGEIINKNKTAVILSFLFAALLLFEIAEPNAALKEAELFEKAYSYYMSYQPEKALELFDVFLREYPNSTAKDSVMFWKAKTLMQLNKADEAKKIFLKIKEQFPESLFRSFSERELETIEKATKPYTVEVIKEEPAGTPDNIAGYEKKLKKLEEEKKELDKNLSELNKKSQLIEKGLSKAIDDRTYLEGALEEERKKIGELTKRIAKGEASSSENAVLKEEKKSLESKLKENEEKIKNLNAERDRTVEKLNSLIKEKEDILAKLKERDRRLSDTEKILASFDSKIKEKEKERDREKQAAEERIKKADQEKAAFEKQIKDKDKELKSLEKKATEEKASLQEELRKEQKKAVEEKAALQEELKKEQKRAADLAGQTDKAETLMKELKTVEKAKTELQAKADTDRRQLEGELKRLQDEREALQKRVKEAEGKDSGIKDLSAKIQEQERKYKEIEGLLKQLKDEKLALEKDIKEREYKEAELNFIVKNLQEKQKDWDELDIYIKQLKEEKVAFEKDIKERDRRLSDTEKILASLDSKIKEYEAQSRKNKVTDAEKSAFRDRMKQYEVPVVRIGDNKYSMLQIIEENIYSSRVKSKMNVETVLWRSGNAYEDFITEQILLMKADQMGVKADNTAYKSLVNEYAFNDREKEYIRKYLTIDNLITRISKENVIDEKDIKGYYESNKDEFLVNSGEKFVRTLSMNYTDKDQIDKTLLAIEFHNAAKSGKSLESLYKSRSDLLVLKDTKYDALPNWIKEKIKDIKSEEISNVISTEDQFIIMQIHFKKPSHRKYEDVRSDILKKLSSKQKKRFGDLNIWLKEIRKEAEEIR